MTKDRAKSIRRAAGLVALIGFLAGGGLIAWGLHMPAKAAVAQFLLERAWRSTLTYGDNVRPWPWADAAVLGVISAPRLGARSVVLDTASGEALAFAPGHVEGTPEPGEPGVAVIAAHRDTHFAFLKDIAPGDEIRVGTKEDDLTFKVTHTEVVRWDASGVTQTRRGAHLVLSTCYPFDALQRGPLRYLVWATVD